MGGLVGIVLYLLFFAVIFVALRWAISGGIRDARVSETPDKRGRGSEATSAREVLDMRYAEGELSQEEYLTIRGDMTRDRDA